MKHKLSAISLNIWCPCLVVFLQSGAFGQNVTAPSQPEERPSLAITRAGESLVISWPVTAGYKLQFASALASNNSRIYPGIKNPIELTNTSLLERSSNWAFVWKTPIIANGVASVRVPMSGYQGFFRLIDPQAALN
jgi:hypothetical protein